MGKNETQDEWRRRVEPDPTPMVPTKRVLEGEVVRRVGGMTIEITIRGDMKDAFMLAVQKLQVAGKVVVLPVMPWDRERLDRGAIDG